VAYASPAHFQNAPVPMSLVRSAVVASNATADRFCRMTVLAGFLGRSDLDFAAESSHWKRSVHQGHDATARRSQHQKAQHIFLGRHEVDNGGWRSALLRRSQPDADALQEIAITLVSSTFTDPARPAKSCGEVIPEPRCDVLKSKKSR
jgi:hypothetical protein